MITLAPTIAPVPVATVHGGWELLLPTPQPRERSKFASTPRAAAEVDRWVRLAARGVPMSLIAQEAGISRERVRQIVAKRRRQTAEAA